MQQSIATICIYFIAIFLIKESNAQDFSHIRNIKLPSTDNLGYPVGDIIAADGKLFLYSTEGIVYFTPSDNPIYDFIDFEGQFGKFNPVLNGNGGNDPNMMTFNEADHFIYTITPDLKIMKVSTINLNAHSIIMNTLYINL